MKHYILDDEGMPVPADDLHEWAVWFEAADRHMGQDEIPLPDGGKVMVSTVFLGMDHGFGSGPPVLWETMIFGGPLDEHMERHADPYAAKEGHEKAVRRVREMIDAGQTGTN